MASLPQPVRHVSKAARQRAQQYLRESGDTALETVEEAESCVRANPESAVWTAFGVGLLLGAIAGWVAAERQHHAWYEDLGDFASKARSRLGW